MNAPSIEKVIEHMKQLRATLAHTLAGGNLRTERFNDATAQLRALDEELLKLGVDPLNIRNGKPRTAPFANATRKKRRTAKRSQGMTLTQRIAEKAQRKRLFAQHGETDTEGPV
jgi:hypothetical protein